MQTPDHGIVATRPAILHEPPARSTMERPPIEGLRSGLILTMQDGSEWFHPYSGAAPRRL